MSPTPGGDPLGSVAIVLHTHLPWVAHAGAWPVGEEWLHQAWSASYLPVVGVLGRLAAQGRRDLLTLGLTPVLAAMLDDPYCLRELHTWLGFWQTRAEGLADSSEEHLRATGAREWRAATDALADFEARWRHGASAVLRPLVDSGVVELLGGPATHPFQPLLHPRVRAAQLGAGRDDTARRLGVRPAGIWAPECGYTPGLEELYAAHGVHRFLVDSPAVQGDTADAHPVGSSDVVAFARDLEVTYRVWSPRSGYPGGRWYRDFHSFDHPSGLRPYRVTSRRSDAKAPYDPDAAAAAVRADATDFVSQVVARLAEHRERLGRPGLVTVAYDTELFGHWWHEGPAWLEEVLRRLPEAGVRVTTLAGALQAGHLGAPVELPASSWGSGKDWRVWDGEQVAELVAASTAVQHRVLGVVDATLARQGRAARDPRLDQLVREAFLVTSSDWAFCVTKDSAAGYARDRAAEHARRAHHLADLIEQGGPPAEHEAARLRALDGVVPSLDARHL